MKKVITLFLAIIFVNIFYAQKKYSITFNKDNFTFEESDAGYYILSNDIDYFLLEDTVLPALPYKGINILIPEGATIDNISVAKTEIKIMENIYMASNPKVVPTSKSTSPVISIITYTEDRYPNANVQLQGYDNMQDFTFASFTICPFIYNAKDKVLTMISNIEISFDVINNLSKKSESAISKRYDMADIVSNLVINPNEISTLYSQTTTKSKTITSDIEYLIITSENLVNDFIPLKAWKIQKGISAEIISTDYIYSNYSGATNQLKIKQCLSDYYKNRKLKWVLLGGDNTIVPVQGVYAKVDDLTDYTIPCDLFYASLSKYYLETWDNDNDGIVGEYNSDGVSMTAEIYLSRAPVRTSDHAKAFIKKTLEYEKTPPASNYVEKMLLTGTKLYHTWNGMSDTHQRSEILYSSYISPYWIGTKTKFYDTGTDFYGGSSYNLTSTNLQDQLGSDYHLVHMATHGSQIKWSMEAGNDYYTINAENLSNQNNAIIITIACNTNAFDDAKYTDDPCLSEAFLRNPNGGCVLYWGSSRFGWGNGEEETSFGPSLKYNAQFFKNLFTGNPSQAPYRFGAITALSKAYYINNSWSYGTYRWLQFSLNAIGDPELPIYTEDPSEFTNASVTQSGTVVTVNTGGVSGCAIALTSVDFGETYFEIENNASIATFTDVVCPYYNVVITKHNYKPYQNPTDRYIQNYTFSSDSYISGKNIYVGNSVIPVEPQGDVIINNGVNVIFVAEQGITFESGFETQIGGAFEVR